MPHAHSPQQAAADALTNAYRQHAVRLRWFVTRIIVDRHLAEDIVHEAFLELWIHPNRHDPEQADLQSWLRTIAHRRAIDRIRSIESARHRDLRIGTREHRGIDHTTDRWDVLFTRSTLRRALGTLTDKQRDAVVLRYLGEQSVPEVARQLGITVGAAKTRVRDGLIALRTHLEPAAAA